MRILIIGGTNFIGPYVIRRLSELGHQVTAFHRGKTTAELPPGVNEMKGDRANLLQMRSDFSRIAPDVVLDMVAYTEQDAQTALDAFRGIAGRIVVISSMDVYRAYGIILGLESGIEPVPLTEESPLREKLYPFQNMPQRPLNAPADYEKILVEKTVMADAELPDAKLPGTVVRLPMVYGPGDPLHRLEPFLQRMDDNRPAIVVEENVARWRGSWGYVENLAQAIALAATDERAKGRIYHVSDSQVFSEAERIDFIKEITGWNGRVAVVSKDQLPAEWQLPINVSQDWLIDSTRIRQELGYNEIVSLDEGFKRAIDWQRSQPSRNNAMQTAPYLLDYATEDAILARL